MCRQPVAVPMPLAALGAGSVVADGSMAGEEKLCPAAGAAAVATPHMVKKAAHICQLASSASMLIIRKDSSSSSTQQW